MERQSRLPSHQINTSSSFMAKAELQKPDGPALEPISIRTDVPPFSHYADIMNPDVPDLTYDCDYDYDFATPHSSSSSHMIPTPVYDWTRPLDEEGMDKKDSYPPLLDDWSPSSVAHYQSSFPSPSHSHYSSPTISRDCALDELNWEKQRYDPLSPTFTTTSIAGIGTTTTRISGPYSTSPTVHPRDAAPQSHPSLQHSYPSSAHNDTPCKSFVQYPTSSSSTSTASICDTVSPSALSLASTSPTLHMPPPPLKLHQPRPSRRIPIISLAELASAGEGLLQPSRTKHSKTKTATQSSHPYSRTSPIEALSPLPLDCNGFSPVLEKREVVHPTSKVNPYQSTRPSQRPNPGPPTRFRHGCLPEKVITCSCGCMESYTIR